MVAATFLVMFVLAEVVLRIANISPVKSTWLVMHENGFMMNQQGGNALHTFEGTSFRYRFSEYRTRGTIDPEAYKNIFVFGDSFAFGLMLQEYHTPVHYLNSRVASKIPDAPVRFVNAGVGGTGMADWVAHLEAHAGDYPIDGIVMMLNYEDFSRSLYKNLFVVTDDGVVRSQRWRQRRIKNFTDNNRVYRKLNEKFHIFSGFQTFVWRYYFVDMTKGFDPNSSRVPVPDWESLDPESDYIIGLADALFGLTASIAEKHGIPVWITTTGFIKEGYLGPFDRKVFATIDGLTAKHGLPYHDITPMLLDLTDGDYGDIIIQGDGHPNREGSRLTGNLVFDAIGGSVLDYFLPGWDAPDTDEDSD